MKYLYYYENFAQSEKYGNPLTEEEFQRLYNENCKIHKDQTVELWRGIRQDKVIFTLNPEIVAYYQNPKGHKRQSIERINLHVTLMSELPSWKNYPPYNQSVIGSTSKKDATEYGKLFEIIPYDNTRIGVCSDENVWETFGGWSDHLYNPIYFVSYFISAIDINNELSTFSSWNTIKNIIIETYNTAIDIEEDEYIENGKYSDYTHIMNFIKKLYEWDNKNQILLDDSGIKILNDYKKSVSPEKIIEFIEYLFEPKRNGFNNLIYDYNFSEKINKLKCNYCENLQVWCEGPVLLKKSFE